MTERNHYEVLGVDKDADDATIRHAFKGLRRKYSRDNNSDDEKKEKEKQENVKEVNNAYTCLKDPEKRFAYDNPAEATQKAAK